MNAKSFTSNIDYDGGIILADLDRMEGARV